MSSPATSVARLRSSALEDTSIGDYRLVALFAEKSLKAIFGVLQHYPPMNGHRLTGAHRRILAGVGRAGIYRMCIRANATPGFLLHRSRASLRLPQCFSFRDGSNTRSTWRFRALITPIRANMVGPPRSATSMSASIAACHSGRSDSFFGRLVMWVVASCSVSSLRPKF
jgi:hypothetical protein